MKPGNCEQAPRDPRQWDGLDTYPVAQVEAFVLRIAALEAENKDLRKRAELADGDVKRAQAILDNSNTYIRRIEVELQSESQAKIDAEFHVAALKERLAARVAELEARCRRLEEAGDFMAYNENVDFNTLVAAWTKAKEAKP